MAQYIDKDALVAEIEKRRRDWHYGNSIEAKYKREECDDILSLINILEVKEADYRPLDEDFERDAVSFCIDTGLNTTPHIAKTIAKHFFELGLLVNNSITAADRGMAEEIIINLKRVEQDYRIDLTKEIEWLRNQAQKGE